MSVLKHIKLGIDEVFYYDYEGEPLPLRPISSWEFDESFYNALLFAPPKIAELVVKIKLGLLKRRDSITIDNKSYASLQKYYDSIDYWIVYNSMKDFQDDNFKKPSNSGLPNGMGLVLKMRHVHDIADFVINTSYKPKEVIKEIVKDEQGKILAKAVFYLNQPLAASYKDLTRLQRDFLVWAKSEDGNSFSKRKVEHSGEIAKIKQKIGDITDVNKP